MKQAVMMSVDLGKSMMSNYSEHMTRSKLAFECIKLFLQQKLFNNAKHQFGLALFGDDEGVEGRSYTIHPLAEPKLELVKQIEQLQELQIENKLQGGDVFEALKFAVDALQGHCGSKKMKKRVFLFTNGQGLTSYGKEEIKKLAEIITKAGTKVNIVVIDFMEGYDPQTNTLEGATSINATQDSNTKHLMYLKESSEDNIKIFPASIAIELYREFRKKETNPVAIYRGPFEIAPGMSFEVATYSQTKEDKMSSLKKYNTKEAFSSNEKDNSIRVESIYHVDGDATGDVIPEDNVISGYRYGPNIVPISPILEHEMRFHEEKCLKLLGFVDKTQIPRSMFMGNITKVIPGEDLRSQKLFSAFIFSMLTLNRYGIARHIPRNMQKGVSPRLVVLIPYKSTTSECFYMTDLPTAEDVREYSFSPLKSSTTAQQQLVDQLITQMDLMTIKDQDGDEFEALKVKNIFNPTKQYLYQALFHRVSHPDGSLPPLDATIRNYMNPEEQIHQQAAPYMLELKKTFGLVKNDIIKEKEAKKLVWAELIRDKEVEMSETSTVADSEGVYWKKFNFDEEPVLHVSSSDPISTFESMINYQKQDLVATAIREMTELIMERLAKVQESELVSSKVMECVKALRKGCVKEREENAWDIWLGGSFDRFPDFVRRELKNEGLGFITRDNKGLFEVVGNSLTKNLQKVEYDDLE